jgi:hypothetical protein
MLQRRLRGLSQSQKTGLGIGLLAVGSVVVVLGIIVAHYANFPDGESVDYFGWIPRGWIPVTIGQIIAFTGSQIMVIGVAIGFLLDRKMTWARASFTAFVVFFQLVMYLGTIPSEWLNLTQGPLEWTEQSQFFTVPPWLVLNNDISISLAFVKDFVSINYNMGILTAMIIFAYKIQDWGKPLPDEGAAEPAVSPYGRPLVKGDR